MFRTIRAEVKTRDILITNKNLDNIDIKLNLITLTIFKAFVDAYTTKM